MRNHVPSSASIYKNQIMQMSSLVSNHYRFLGPQVIDVTPLQRLYLETQCMALIIEAFSSLTEQASADKPAPGLPLRHRQRMQQVKEMLESGAADHLAIADIANSVNMSESSLQRYFRQTFDMTVFEYLRNCRLQRAVLAMQREGVGIAQAASLAGYTSPANFATALRRVYGLTPGQLKNRV
ncbi:helix-turn-helix transcriptional regulator [Dickeya dadantii subsp. dieffenbachiae]|uniref:helix-turn-helix transcriptional regulator n=1 Tax=Dickeya dadantii TaxID=204038 RepID=UPI0005767C79|nr:AraC family transcriptional regulator [Dickeya dadantii]